MCIRGRRTDMNRKGIEGRSVRVDLGSPHPFGSFFPHLKSIPVKDLCAWLFFEEEVQKLRRSRSSNTPRRVLLGIRHFVTSGYVQGQRVFWRDSYRLGRSRLTLGSHKRIFLALRGWDIWPTLSLNHRSDSSFSRRDALQKRELFHPSSL